MVDPGSADDRTRACDYAALLMLLSLASVAVLVWLAWQGQQAAVQDRASAEVAARVTAAEVPPLCVTGELCIAAGSAVVRVVPIDGTRPTKELR